MNKEYQIKFHYVEHPDGSVPTVQLIRDIVHLGKEDPLFARLARHFRYALSTIELRGVPDWNIQNFSYEWTIPTKNGWTVRVDPLVKRLNHAYPLYELRINEWRHRGQEILIQHIYFVNGMIKREKSPARFEELIAEALQIYESFKTNWSKGE
ncbi:hypothetical protein CLV36_11747 [Laceyella sediminis]|uniref:Uncharacterized protein n=1 Tax=Laceyella sediminis TaxID=573074 RepID=A0ABX5EMM2_9BACL|nr:hypothetical protein [Laceyella sediminis]PRZ12068.1 hypothetical protein CLV36_11747 [Laceyella sediminis]